MIFVWALLLAAAAVGNAKVARIVGGELTTIERLPSMAQVDYRNYLLFYSQNCAATIFTNRFVLTAAHCFEGFLFEIGARRLRVGSSYRNEGGTIVYLSDYFNHPSYDGNTNNHDISVVKTEEPLTYSLTLQPQRLISQGLELAPNTPVVIAGWGAIGAGGSGGWSYQLRQAEVYVVDQSVCASRYAQLGSEITDNMICAGVLGVSDRDSCEGDDGGPMYVNGTLAGIVSWGQSCADPVYPRVNTKVSAYSEWIEAMMVEA